MKNFFLILVSLLVLLNVNNRSSFSKENLVLSKDIKNNKLINNKTKVILIGDSHTVGFMVERWIFY